MESVLALSYRALEERTAYVLRMLGTQPAEDATVLSVAALCGLDPAEAERILTSLVGEHLLGEPGPGRYRLHDLVRVHVAGIARGTESEDERDAALDRLYDWYTAAAYEAGRHLRGYPGRVVGTVPVPAAPIPAIDDRDGAIAWFDAEYANLHALERHAAATGRRGHVMRIMPTVRRWWTPSSPTGGRWRWRG